MSFETWPARRGRLLLVGATLVSGALCAAVVDEALAARPAPAGALARDEEFVLRFAGRAPLGRVRDDVRVTPPAGSGLPGARGSFVAGRALVDPVTHRAVVVRPEALREYYELFSDMDPADADAATERTLARVQRTGNLKPLAAIDLSLRWLLGPSGGTRLDDPAVLAMCPPPKVSDPPVFGLRELIAGDDGLWRAYLAGGDVSGFAKLQADPRYERFHHPVDPLTGVRSATSVLRQREHRRVLMRRAPNLITFLPDIPIRADLSDVPYAAGTTYGVTAGPSVRSLRALLPARGGVVRFILGAAPFTVAADLGDGGTFLGGVPWTGTPTAGPPRVVNMTPPSGETYIDPTTDWEDPDNQFTTPIPARRLFTIRLRFDRPLDPRTVTAANFAITGRSPSGAPVFVPITLGVNLFQRRMGEILVEITPATILTPQAVYDLRVSGALRALDGTPLGAELVLPR